MDMSTNVIVVINRNTYVCVSNHYIVPLKVTECCLSTISQKSWKSLHFPIILPSNASNDFPLFI